MSNYRKPGEPPTFTRIHALAISGLNLDAPVVITTDKVPASRWKVEHWAPEPNEHRILLIGTEPLCHSVLAQHELEANSQLGLINPNPPIVTVQLRQDGPNQHPMVAQAELRRLGQTDPPPEPGALGKPTALLRLDTMTPAFNLAELLEHNTAQIRALENSPHNQ